MDKTYTSGCQTPFHPRALYGMELFNQGKFFEAHEELEAAWMAETGPIRDLYRGILQVAVAYYHAKHGNIVGARKMLARCTRWLAPFPAECQGLDIAALRDDADRLDRILAEVKPFEVNNPDYRVFPPLTLRPIR